MSHTYGSFLKGNSFCFTEFASPGKLVTLALLDRRGASHALSVASGVGAERLTQKINIILTKDQRDLSPRLQKLYRLNIDFDNLFKEHLITYLKAQQLVGTPVYVACGNFLDHYKIEESEISKEALYKCWQRSKSKKNTPDNVQ